MTISTENIVIHLVIFIVNIILFYKSKTVVTFLNHKEDNNKTKVFQAFNILLFVTQILDLTFKEYGANIINVGYSLVVIYVGAVAYEVATYYNRRRVGTKIDEEKDEETGEIITPVKYENNYHTRINNIFIFVFIFAIALLYVLKLWDMESALEQKGIIGVILAALFFTSNHWLPNIFKGLSLMNSNRLSKGDLIKIDDLFYLVDDMGLQYTQLLNVKKDEVVILENSHLSKGMISNISKKSAMSGYRDTIVYKIGYPDKDIIDEENYDAIVNKWKDIFKELYEELKEIKDSEDNKDIKISTRRKYELFMTDAADSALVWEFSFYYDGLGKARTTQEARKILSARHVLNEMVQKKAHLRGIALSTPFLVENTINSEGK